MTEMQSVYSAVQREADAAKDFGLRELASIAAATIGVGALLTVIGAVL